MKKLPVQRIVFKIPNKNSRPESTKRAKKPPLLMKKVKGILRTKINHNSKSKTRPLVESLNERLIKGGINSYSANTFEKDKNMVHDLRKSVKDRYNKFFEKIIDENDQERIKYETKKAENFIKRVHYTDEETTYNKVITDRLVSGLIEDSDQKGDNIDTMIEDTKNGDPNFSPVKCALISSTNVGEGKLSNRLEAKILLKAVDRILKISQSERKQDTDDTP
ncbi:unnamed protein product [Moneuplotes crassus]|uniref:Uncharacterized protein n=1 Tax=Euplotes crassus TaxID=5936 RepID=A0AAD1UG21_EUPCR|nr:unnamed protein product [Moneuplotes crassus]